MEKLSKINTRNEIMELQKKENITITLTKKQAQLIGFAIGTEIENNEQILKNIVECINTEEKTKKMEEEKKKKMEEEKKKMFLDTEKFIMETSLELEKIRDNLKKYYGFIID